MTDPINPSGRSLTGSISNSTNRAAPKANAPESTANSSSDAQSSPQVSSDSVDTVSLSTGSQQVIELQQQLKTAPEIDAVKIDAIRQEIANGNYPLDAQKIAENFINLEQSLIE